MLCDNEAFRKHNIDYLNIIIRNIEQYKSIKKMAHVNDEIQHIHPCATRPPNNVSILSTNHFKMMCVI
jgi:hypothetical protein